MEKTNKLQRFQEAYMYLRDKGEIHQQQDIADRLNTDKSNVSRAFKGDSRYLTDRFLKRFANAFDEISVNWLLTGEGEMLLGDITNGDGSAQAVGHGSTATVGVDASQFIDVIKKQQEQIDRLLSILEKKK